MARTKIIKAISLQTVESFLLFFPAGFAHARYISRMIDRFPNWGDHGKPKSGKIKGRCQPPLKLTNYETTRFPERSAGKRSHLKDVYLCLVRREKIFYNCND